MNWRIVLWVLIYTPIFRLLYKMAIDEQITRGDLIGACIAGIASLVGGAISFKNYYTHHRPFTMLFADKPCKDSGIKFASSLSLPIGLSRNVFVSLRLREGRSLETIGLRFVQRDWSKWPWANEHWRKVSESVVMVREIRDQEAMTGLGNSPDNMGGILGTFRDVKRLPKDAVLWLQVSLEARQEFSGYLSFEQKRGDNYRGFSRRKVTFGIRKNWLEKIGEPIGVYYEYPKS